MTFTDLANARDWYEDHEAHIKKLVKGSSVIMEPMGSDVGRPELWKDIHWRWFLREIK